MKQNSNVPAFLTKLWTLVEDEDTNEFICWSQEGNSFLVLDEQRFAKEILPKFFKHNNMASFIRQLNMYGFRKVMHIDIGIVKQERDGPVEFQHPYFKHGQDDLLENIKRKVSNTRPEDNKIRHEDLSKILASVHSVHSKQENINLRLATLKRENEALWREVSDLRQKHSHQQQLIKKLIHFIITLVQSKHILNLKRKRSILMNGKGKKTKYIHEVYDEESCIDQMSVNSLNGVKGAEISEDIICNLTQSDTDGTADITHTSPRAHEQGDVEIIEVELESCEDLSADSEMSPTFPDHDVQQTEEKTSSSDNTGPTDSGPTDTGPTNSGPTDTGPTSSALQLNKTSGLNLEDPVKIMDSIINENGAISQNINLLGKVELMDYLDSIDCSLEDFQAMLYEKQFGIDFDSLEENISKENTNQPIKGRQDKENTDKQLIQYTSHPVLTFLDGYALASELDLGSTGTTSTDSSQTQPVSCSGVCVDSELHSELLDSSLDSKQPPRSSLIRLEPLTEAEASQETLFYLCELSPDEAEDGSDSAEENLLDHRLQSSGLLKSSELSLGVCE